MDAVFVNIQSLPVAKLSSLTKVIALESIGLNNVIEFPLIPNPEDSVLLWEQMNASSHSMAPPRLRIGQTLSIEWKRASVV